MNTGDMHPSAVRLLNTIGEERQTQIWEALCDTFTRGFRTKQAISLISAECHVSRKTASLWFGVLRQFWLVPGNSDLIRMRMGFYDWKTVTDDVGADDNGVTDGR